MKGNEREKNLENEFYYADIYFTLDQLTSYAEQIHTIHSLKPKTILEVGIGSGLVSDFMKKSGYDVTTVDINEKLNPNIVSSIADLPANLQGETFDLVVCCEVLEHMPFSEFEQSIKILKIYSDQLFLTLPRFKIWYGLSVFYTFPKLKNFISIGVEIKRKKKNLNNSNCHFFEINSSEQSSRKNIIKLISKYFKKTNHFYFKVNKFHEGFICKDESK